MTKITSDLKVERIVWSYRAKRMAELLRNTPVQRLEDRRREIAERWQPVVDRCPQIKGDMSRPCTCRQQPGYSEDMLRDAELTGQIAQLVQSVQAQVAVEVAKLRMQYARRNAAILKFSETVP